MIHMQLHANLLLLSSQYLYPTRIPASSCEAIEPNSAPDDFHQMNAVILQSIREGDRSATEKEAIKLTTWPM
jgi:hypothetical protein